MTFKFIVSLVVEAETEEEAFKKIKSGLKYNEMFDKIKSNIQSCNVIKDKGDKRQLV